MIKIYQLKKQQGFSIALILGLIVILGVLSYIGSTVYNSIVNGNQRISLNTMSSQSLTQAAYVLTTETTRNASGIPVASPILSNSFAPTDGGIIPTASAAPKLDSYGSPIGYCINTASAQSDPVFAVVSAGSNKTFNTTCTQALAGTAFGDDKVIYKSVINILQGVGGTVYFGDPVSTVANLGTLTAASIKPGQLRTVLADASVYVNKTGTAGASYWEKTGSPSSASGNSSWQDFKASRAFNTEYTNASTKAIDMKYSYSNSGTCFTSIKINTGSSYVYINQTPNSPYVTASAIIPPGAKYMVEASNAQCVIIQWHEFL